MLRLQLPPPASASLRLLPRPASLERLHLALHYLEAPLLPPSSPTPPQAPALGVIQPATRTVRL